MVDLVDEAVMKVQKKKKKSKERDVDLSESSIKRKLETETDESVKIKKKKKKKDKDIEDEIEVPVKKKKENTDKEVVQDKLETDVSEAPVKKKKPYFRDKGDKKNTEKCSDDKKSKFSISLPVGESNTGPDLPVLKSTGKGPKIIIAQEKKAETVKPEVKLSKRKRKHLKAEGTLVDDSVHESVGMSKALRYLKTWEEDREAWKFEKCRQIWLLHNAYDDSKVSEILFPSLLSYMSSVKGGMREGAMDRAKEIVKKAAKWEEMADDKSEEELIKELGSKVSDVELKRANKICESLS